MFGKIKIMALAIILGLIITFAINGYANKVEQDFQKSLIRLHIVANSNSETDQKIKLLVRDRIIKEMGDKLTCAKNFNDSKEIIENNLEFIEEVSNDELLKNNSPYKAKAMLGLFDFPTKNYDTVSLPFGKYQALKVVIGNGIGKNWWCVMFPPLCFVGVENAKMPDQSKDVLKNSLTSDEYSLITEKNDNIGVNIKFKIVELWQQGKLKATALK